MQLWFKFSKVQKIIILIFKATYFKLKQEFAKQKNPKKWEKMEENGGVVLQRTK